MILNILIHKNKKLNCFTQPLFIDVDPEKVAIQESRSLAIADKGETILPYKHLELYFVGLFNDETGEIILKDENGDSLLRDLLDCTPVVNRRLKELGWTKKKSSDGVVVDA